MLRRAGVACAVALLCGAAAAAGQLCGSWSDGETLGILDSRLVPEASGLIASREPAQTLYHVNDSGGGSFLYASDQNGSNLRQLALEGLGHGLFDPEALALGQIAGQTFIFIGDIGDNYVRRPTVALLAVAEKNLQGEAAPVAITLSARYDDGPHNAEAMVMGPDGALYIFTKSWTNRSLEPASSFIYRLGPEAWTHPSGETATLERIGEIDLPALAAREHAPFSDVVTDAAMSEGGSRFLLLTYGYAWEFALDLSSGELPPAEQMQRGEHYQLIRLKPLLGKETIAYLPGDRSFLYGKEFKPDSRPSELIRVDCLD